MSSVLLVDDDPGVLDVVAFTLRREGFDVDEETDGARALAAARSRDYDIVILDVMLPQVSGTDVCRALRAESDVPIVMLTARDAEVDRVLGLELDLVRHRVRVDGREVELTASELSLLSLLASAPDRVFARREIMQHLWNSTYVGSERACDIHVSNLRRKIERDPARPERLLTVRSAGYKLVPV